MKERTLEIRGDDALQFRLTGEAGIWRGRSESVSAVWMHRIDGLGAAGFPCDGQGRILPAFEPSFRKLSVSVEAVGEALGALLSDDALEIMRKLIETSGHQDSPSTLIINAPFEVEQGGHGGPPLVGLPWELLEIDGARPVEDGCLDIVRRAWSGLPDPPTIEHGPLRVIATLPSPSDSEPLISEQTRFALESSRLRLKLAADGTLVGLGEAIAHHHAHVVHFSGHGRPGGLLFDDSGRGAEVPIQRFIEIFRTQEITPQMVYLSACEESDEHIAALDVHRAGVPHVVGYAGRIATQLAIAIEQAFYEALAEGRTVRFAVHAARRATSKPISIDGQLYRFPWAWSALNLYQRERDAPLIRSGGDLATKPRRFFGRDQEMAELAERVRQGARVLIVVGIGGMGKSALCEEMFDRFSSMIDARQRVRIDARAVMAADDPLAALWMQLRAELTDQHGIAIDRARRRYSSGEGWAATLATFGPVMVSFEELEACLLPIECGGGWAQAEIGMAWSKLVALARSQDDLLVLASSRRMPPEADDGDRFCIGPLERDAARSWLDVAPGFAARTSEERRALAEAAAGHPLTLRFIESLVERPGTVDELMVEASRHVEIERLVETIWFSLSVQTRDHLGRCTVLMGAAPHEVYDALGTKQGTRELLDLGLLAPASRLDRSGHWALHPQVRAVIEGLWPGNRRKAHARIGRWGAALPLSAQTVYVSELVAKHLLEAGEPESAWPFVRDLSGWHLTRGRAREALDWLKLAEPKAWGAGETTARRLCAEAYLELDALDAAESAILPALTEPDATRRAEIHRAYVRLLNAQGHDEEAASVLAQTLVEAQRNQIEPGHIARLRLERSQALYASGDLEAAQADLEAALPHLGRPLDQIAARHRLGTILRERGVYDRARNTLEQALLDARAYYGHASHPRVSDTLHELGRLNQVVGELDTAQRYYQEALVEAENVLGREHRSVALSYQMLGDVLCGLHQPDEAREKICRAIEIYRSLGEHGADLVRTYLSAAAVEAWRDPNTAWPHFEAAKALLGPHSSASLRADVLQTEGFLRDFRGEPGASAILREALQLRREANGITHISYIELAILYALAVFNRDNVEEATQVMAEVDQAMEQSGLTGVPYIERLRLLMHTELALEHDDFELAASLGRRAVEQTAGRTCRIELERGAWELLTRALRGLARWPEAFAAHEKVIVLLGEEHGDPEAYPAVRSLWALGQYRSQYGDPHRALDELMYAAQILRHQLAPEHPYHGNIDAVIRQARRRINELASSDRHEA